MNDRERLIELLEEVGEAVKFYAMECAAINKTPTFKGLIEHIQKKRWRGEHR